MYRSLTKHRYTALYTSSPKRIACHFATQHAPLLTPNILPDESQQTAGKFIEREDGARQGLQTSSESPTSPASLAMELPLLPGQRKLRNENIVIDSLHATIQAHRDANRAKIIRKHIVQDTSRDPGWRHLEPVVGDWEKKSLLHLQGENNAENNRTRQELRLRFVKNHSSGPRSLVEAAVFPEPYRQLRGLKYSCDSQERYVEPSFAADFVL